jgi:membrane-bound lytic murein transglycosylase MltF
VTVTRGAAPGSTGTRGLLTAERTAEFTQRWRDLQADFVDDPQQAVRGAGELSREILQALSDTIADAERVDSWKAEDGTSGTEDLRIALRQYRTLVDRLLEL